MTKSPGTITLSSTLHRFGRPDAWYPFLLVAIGVLFFADALFTSRNFYFRDVINFHYPLRRILIEAWSRGEFPLWNPFIYLGQPLLANPNYLTFYPTNLLHLVLPFDYAFKLHFILHPIVGGLGLYALQRRLGLVPLAAFAGALVYEFAGTTLSFLNLFNIIPVVALMPWIGWAFWGALGRPSRGRVIAFGFLLGLQVLALEPLVFQCDLWLLAGLALLWVGESSTRRSGLRAVAAVLIKGVAFGVGISAVQWLPTLELLPLSARAEGFSYREAALWSVRPLDLLNVAVPNFYGVLFTIGNPGAWGPSLHGGREPYLVSYFMGAATLLLAAIGCASKRQRLRTVLLGLTVVSLFFSLGENNPLHRALFDHVPLLRMGRYPSKLMLLGTISVSMLAALGLELVSGLPAMDQRRRRLAARIGAAGLVLAVCTLVTSEVATRHMPALTDWMKAYDDQALAAVKDYQQIFMRLQGSFLASAAFLAVTAFVILAAARRSEGRLPSAGLLLLLAAEVLPPNLGLAPLISAADLSLVAPINRFIQESGPREPYRVLGPTVLREVPDVRLSVPNLSQAWMIVFAKLSGQPFFGIEHGMQYSLDKSVDFLNTRESDQLVRKALRMGDAARVHLMRRLNTPVVVSLGDLKHPLVKPLASFETRSDTQAVANWLEGCVPRAFLASGVEVSATAADALERFTAPSFEFDRAVILNRAEGKEQAAAPKSGHARIVSYESSRVVCQTECSQAGYLVLLDSYYPGWRATVDGVRVPVLRADFAFRAVALTPGTHLVEFRFVPVYFYIGLALSLATSSLALILILNDRREGGL